MLFASLRSAYRIMRRRWRTSTLSIGGLALGIGVSILAGLFVLTEYSVGWHHDDAESIYRIHEDGKAYTYDDELFYLQESLADRVSVVGLVRDEGVVERSSATSQGGAGAVRSDAVTYATDGVFDVLTYPLSQGDAQTALQDPSSVVISADVAAKLFPEESPIGKVLIFPSGSSPAERTITGVMEPLPPSVHYRPDFLMSMANITRDDGYIRWWIHVYAKVEHGTDIQDVLASLNHYRESAELRRPDELLQATPLTDIYLHTEHDEELAPTGSIVYVGAFAIVGILILLIACINYVTITTAQMGERVRTVGLRKTFGAERGQIIVDFVAEASLTSGIAFLLGCLGATAVIPVFNRIAPSPVNADQLLSFEGGLLALGIMLATVILASGYPAFRLSKLRPKELFDQTRRPSGSAFVRKTLVTTQLALAVALTAVTGVIVQQSIYLANKDLGLDREHTLMVNTRYAGTGRSGVLTTEERARRLDVIEARLRDRSDIRATGRTAYRPNSDWVFFRRLRLPETAGDSEADTQPDESGAEQVEPSTDADRVAARVMYSTEGVTEALGLRLLEGKSLAEVPDGAIINQKAADMLGPGAVAGAPMYTSTMRGDSLTVIAGIVDNFHFETLRTDIRPVVIMRAGTWREDEYLLVRSKPGKTREVRDAVEAVWNDVMPAATFDATYMDQEFNEIHASEYKQRTLLLILGVLTLLVSCIGLIGLVAYVADRRKAEIGVRKTLGASASSIVRLFTRDIAASLLVGSIVALPVAYMVAHRWLEQFAYRITPGVPILILAVGIVGTVAIAAAASQAYRAAQIDPALAVREE